uniref:Uncharacterized protein n=1 Tax=Panagrolaimus davidi TaxID=227884 RepID=A0A914Q155_9BILA
MHQYIDIKDNCGTHVVVGLIWGLNITVDLFIETKGEKHKSEIKQKLEGNFAGKVFSVNGNGHFEKEELSKISKIRFETNDNTGFNIPENAEEALKIFEDLPKKLNVAENAQIMEIHLLQLSVLKAAVNKVTIGQSHGSEIIIRNIENDIIKNVEITFEEGEIFHFEMLRLEEFLVEHKDFIKVEETQTLKTFINDYKMTFSKFKQDIAVELKKVRSGNTKSDEIRKICQNFKQNFDVGVKKVEESVTLSQKIKERISKM